MAAANFTPEQMKKIKEVTSLTYAEQAIFYLNAFWNDKKPAEAEAEDVWKLAEAFAKEDHVKGKNGNELNPIQAFHVLQARNQTLTALELKAQLRKVDIDANGEMALAEYLLFINDRDPIAFITNPQGETPPELLAAAKAKLEALSNAFDELQKKQELSVIAEKNAKEAAAAAVVAEEEVKRLTEEAKVIAAEIKREEEAKEKEIARLEALTQDQSVGIVKRNMAVQQLATAKNEDPLPLRKAKLTQDATVRRLTKATELAAQETARSAQAAIDAAEAVKAVQAAIVQCEKDLENAQEEFNKLANSGAGLGLVWWGRRQIEEKKRSLPQRMW